VGCGDLECRRIGYTMLTETSLRGFLAKTPDRFSALSFVFLSYTSGQKAVDGLSKKSRIYGEGRGVVNTVVVVVVVVN